MAERAEIVIVGAGVMGAATAYALARAGHEPVVLEQFELGHTRGSSHGRGRIFRLVYHDPHWVAQLAAGIPPKTETVGKGPPTVGSVPFDGVVVSTAKWFSPSLLVWPAAEITTGVNWLRRSLGVRL